MATNKNLTLDSSTGGTLDLTEFASLEEVNTKIGNMDDLNTELASDTIVGAINNLFQSANNGKQLIASAIGEPLNAEDTFSAMSSDINSLLSTFKTNMMNSGVTVESGDKFKILIDKIATMAGEGGNKGIKFAEGSIPTTRVSGTRNFTIDIDFTPTYFFVHGDVYYQPSGGSINIAATNVLLTSSSQFVARYASVTLSNVTNIGFTISTSGTVYSSYMDVDKWYAIGVGEEDTTLRDTLAGILQDEGVEVTEDDDMASLITKTDEEFDDRKKTLVDKIISKNVSVDINMSWEEIINSLDMLADNPYYFLYNEGDECIDLTGGWTHSVRTLGWFQKNANKTKSIRRNLKWNFSALPFSAP